MAKGDCLQWFFGATISTVPWMVWGDQVFCYEWSEGIVYLLCGGNQKEVVNLLLIWWFSKTDQLATHKYSMYMATRLSMEKLKSIHWLAISNCSWKNEVHVLATSPSISRTQPLARLSTWWGELACELSKRCEFSAVESTEWVLFNTAITPARNGIGWEIAVVRGKGKRGGGIRWDREGEKN